ncbi:2-amino-4-hydroxy-6-hydroxymethyldihydropteridine diphosphokinase [Pseudoroseomonas cervicalis]|uniref:2-amino-4-hydroxy-6- hydroxymethyldihydropteridine diphosphokinase n=1 Tax=Teichococcus cervicalis TaxID=204525 RepID=UPI00278A97C5|nr:2-amino-4-hydroxy-6-hydroxymethyldihydropteridine diphosphokinase [Pseudoroseomonas cervicalis]MDQ1078878.1 2-amino-4-hydroxy-6-hydroxymethyldihydropteridine diphosphokinase [Pseudoroseomonas cervicalis]
MILIALGANLPGRDGAAPRATCEAAVDAMARIPGLAVQAVSAWWETAPEPPSPGAPWYVNGVARCEGTLDPAALLAALQAIEDAAGRERPYPNAPRTLDLDIIAMGEAVRESPDPILPHPRAHLRRFVLQPLSEVAPGWVHPQLGQSVEALLAELPEAGMRKISK